MRRFGVTIFCVIALGLIAGCDGDGDGGGGGGGSGLSGAWQGTANYILQSGSMTGNVTMNLTQSGNVVTGTYHIDRPNRTMDGSISGTINSTNIILTLSPHGQATGTTGGGVMNLNFFEDWGGGKGLNATMSLGKL